MALNLDSYLGVHAQALTLEAQRTELLAANLANADTPNYKARDIDFKAALAAAGGDGASGSSPPNTGPRHRSRATASRSSAARAVGSCRQPLTRLRNRRPSTCAGSISRQYPESTVRSATVPSSTPRRVSSERTSEIRVCSVARALAGAFSPHSISMR